MVEIIPKISKEKSKKSVSLFYLGIFLLFFSVSAYFSLNHLLKAAQEQLAVLEMDLIKTMSSEEIALEREVLASKNKVETFAQLIGKHPENSRIFALVEKNCHPKVWFSFFSFNPLLGQLSVSGQTESFKTLGQQIFILKEEEKIKKVDLSGVSITEEGGISFELLILFDPVIFVN